MGTKWLTEFLTKHMKTGVYVLIAGADFKTQIFKFTKRIGFVKESIFQRNISVMNASRSDNVLKYIRQKLVIIKGRNQQICNYTWGFQHTISADDRKVLCSLS